MHIIVPVKSFDAAKQRLSAACSPQQRRNVARAMALHLLGELQRVRRLEDVIIVSDEPEMARFADAHGLRLVVDGGDGLNAAVEIALRTVPSGAAAGVVHADLPLFQARAFSRLVGQHEGGGRQVTIVTDMSGTGTNILLCTPREAMKPRFGSDSCARHREMALAVGLQVEIVRSPSLSRDCDTPEDLSRLGRLIRKGAPLEAVFKMLRSQHGLPGTYDAQERHVS